MALLPSSRSLVGRLTEAYCGRTFIVLPVQESNLRSLQHFRTFHFWKTKHSCQLLRLLALLGVVAVLFPASQRFKGLSVAYHCKKKKCQ